MRLRRVRILAREVSVIYLNASVTDEASVHKLKVAWEGLNSSTLTWCQGPVFRRVQYPTERAIPTLQINLKEMVYHWHLEASSDEPAYS